MNIRTFHFVKSHKIGTQMRAIFMFTIVVPLMVVGLFAIANSRSQMLSHYEVQLQTDALRVNSTLFDITTAVRTMTSSFVEDNKYRNIFRLGYNDNSVSHYRLLTDALKNYKNITAAVSDIRIYTDNPSIPENDNIVVETPIQLEAELWHMSLREDMVNHWLVMEYTDRFGNTNWELTLVEQMIIKDSPYRAYLVTRLDNNYLRNRLLTSDNVIMICLDQSQVFFASDRNWIMKKMPDQKISGNANYNYMGKIQMDSERQLATIISFMPYQTQNYFYTLVADPKAYKNINSITVSYLLILLLAASIPMILIGYYSKNLSRRIDTLRTAMHQASLGDYNIIDNFSGDDELTETFQDLKATVNDIHEKEARYYEAQIAQEQLATSQQQMKFKILASQINPHFLYNTLETIRMQAITSGNREVANSVNLLGKTMHYVLENTGADETTLAKELEHVRTYLQIQKLRFGDRVNEEIYIPPYISPEQIHLPPLLLQPIVENAIVHGLEGVTAHGVIEIRLVLEEPNLYLMVSDNGEGMDVDTIQKLQDHMERQGKSKRSSIALRNINDRLKLAYGEAYTLSIESHVGVGTTVTIPLPMDKVSSDWELREMLQRREQYLGQEIEDDE